MTLTLDTLAQAIFERFKIKTAKVVPDATLEELGFDSLSLVDLAVLLQRKFDIKVRDANLGEISRISDILALAGVTA